jgi:hypothetical protein
MAATLDCDLDVVTVDLPKGVAAGLVPGSYAAGFMLLPGGCQRQMHEIHPLPATTVKRRQTRSATRG